MKNYKALPGADMNTDRNLLLPILNLLSKKCNKKAKPKGTVFTK